jgi:branched-chain amino acid transport system permease protein
VLATLLGGRGTLWGPVIGAFILEPLANFTSTNLGGADAGAIRLLLFGGLLGAVVLFLPRGVLPTVSDAWQRRHVRATADTTAANSAKTPSPRSASRHTSDDVGRDVAGAVLQVERVAKSFGGLRAVDEASLTVTKGSITGLIGPNGSGKTTLFNLIDGTIGADAGRIALGGARIDRRGRPSRAHAGLARTYQLPRLFSSLTVVENVVVAEPGFSLRRLWRPRLSGSDRDRAMAVLDDLGLAAYADTSPAALSYGQRKLIELAQVLWLNPVLVMLDEPAAGISPALSQRLAAMIQNLHSQGVCVLLIEHDLAFLAGLCDQVYVMANGKIIASGTVAEVSADGAVVDAYLGDSVAALPAVAHA